MPTTHDMETEISPNPQEGVVHGPWKPLGEAGLAELQRWEGDEYDFTDIALQSLHQLYGNIRAASDALRHARVSEINARYLEQQNQLRIDSILDRYLTR